MAGQILVEVGASLRDPIVERLVPDGDSSGGARHVANGVERTINITPRGGTGRKITKQLGC